MSMRIGSEDLSVLEICSELCKRGKGHGYGSTLTGHNAKADSYTVPLS